MLSKHLAKENDVMKQNHLPELADSDLEAVSGGTGSEGESGSPSPSELAVFTASAQEFAIFTQAVNNSLEGASDGTRTLGQ
jgi:hypothetical protein